MGRGDPEGCFHLSHWIKTTGEAGFSSQTGRKGGESKCDAMLCFP